MNFILAQFPLNKKSICPTLIHDDATRMITIALLLLVSTIALYRVMVYYGR